MAELVNSYNQVVEIWADVCMDFENKMRRARKRVNPRSGGGAEVPFLSGCHFEALADLIVEFLGRNYSLRGDTMFKYNLCTFIHDYRHNTPLGKTLQVNAFVKELEANIRAIGPV